MILCLGTTPTVQRTMVFDRLSIDAVNRAVEVHETASGKSINVARVLRALGRQALATGFLGGQRGRFIRSALGQIDIAHDFIEVDPPTRLCVTAVDRFGATATELVEESAAVAPEAYDRLLQVVDANLWRSQALVLSGSLPPQAPPDFYARCVSLAAGKTPVVVDGRGQALRLAIAQRPAVVKPNRAELAATVGRKLESDDALRAAMTELVSLGAKWVVVTLGASGALATDGQNWWHVDAPQVKVVNTIGSGDAFAAGLAAGLADDQPLEQACALGAACAGANAMSLIAGQVSADDVHRLRPLIGLRKA